MFKLTRVYSMCITSVRLPFTVGMDSPIFQTQIILDILNHFEDQPKASESFNRQCDIVRWLVKKKKKNSYVRILLSVTTTNMHIYLNQ